MSEREVMRAGARAVVNSAWDLVRQGTDPGDAAHTVLARKPVLTESAREYLMARGLADVLREIQAEAAEAADASRD